MTTFDYEGLRDDVVEGVLTEFGLPATLTQPGASTGDAWDPTPGTPTTYAVTVLNKQWTAADRSGGLVREDDRKFMLSTTGNPVPGLNGTLTVGSDVLQVIAMTPVGPGATVLFWNMHCRK